MPTYRLRDSFLCFAIEQERAKELTHAMFLAQASIGSGKLNEALSNYMNTLFPWQEEIRKQEVKAMTNEYIRMFGSSKKDKLNG